MVHYVIAIKDFERHMDLWEKRIENKAKADLLIVDEKKICTDYVNTNTIEDEYE